MMPRGCGGGSAAGGVFGARVDALAALSSHCAPRTIPNIHQLVPAASSGVPAEESRPAAVGTMRPAASALAALLAAVDRDGDQRVTVLDGRDGTSGHDPEVVSWFLYVPHDDPLAER
jgi:hypothetical protein